MANQKTKITQSIINLMPEDGRVPLDEAMHTWYQNIRSTGGMRLTSVGYKLLESLAIEHWQVSLKDLKDYMTKSLLLELDRKITYPYYIDYKKRKVIFFSSKEAMLATLYGDLAQFLKHYQS